MTFDSIPPEVQEELAAVRKAVDSLRAAAVNHRPPEVLEPSNAAVLAVGEAYDEAMKDLAPLGFSSFGDAGERRKDGSIAVSRWFGHSDGAICGWLGFISTKSGPRLLVFLVTEGSGPAYCTSLRGGSGLSLARPPHVSHADHQMSVSLADVVRGHRERLSSLTAAGMRLTGVTTLGQALKLMERLHQARMTWRASSDEHELLRADLRSALANSYRDMAAGDFWLIYSHAAKWLDFSPARPTHPGARSVSATPSDGASGDRAPLVRSTLADFLESTLTGPEADQGTLGTESDWLFHCEFEVQGTRLQMLDVSMAGNDGEGVILDVSPGVYVVEARVMTYGIDRRISRVRIHPKGAVGTLGEVTGEVGVDLAAVAICDVDRLAGWAQAEEAEWQRWGHPLWYGRTTPAGIYACAPAKTIVPFIDTGFGDGTYPVQYLMYESRPVGLEAVFIPAGTPYV